jgi:sarcosine oxidase subunit alpha
MLNNVSSHYSAINIAGKEATAIISQLVDNKMKTSLLKTRRIHQLTIAKIDVLVMRTNFVSKTAFEIHVPFKQASALWNAILEAGKPYQLMPFGTEAQRILRLEMGHLLIGLDTDGLTNPFEAGFESIVHLDKPFFVGQRSLQIIKQKPCNKQLVAFTLAAKQTNINQAKECNLVIENNDITGRVTSISFSPTLQQTIGLAYVHPRQSTIGSTFHIRTDSGAMVNATVVNKPFIEQSEY